MRTAVTNVRIFDGVRLTDPTTLVIDGGAIGTDATGARRLDAAGGVLLPGLIDTHIHLSGTGDLETLAEHGVTTGLDMATWPPALIDSLRHAEGLTDIRSAGAPAIGAGGAHAKIPGFPKYAIVTDPTAAQRFVEARIAEGSDYIKIVAEPPGAGGPDQATLDSLVLMAHAQRSLVIAHAVATGAWAMAQRAAVDVITHTPLDAPLNREAVAKMAAEHRVVIPTLAMMEAIVERSGRPRSGYDNARVSVTKLYEAGVPILAGTDANSAPGVPAAVPHGISLHHELELLVEAGLTTVDALRAATSLPATYFGLADRGAIEPGLRADLLLIDGDPIHNIRATRDIRRIWCGGIERNVGL